MIYKDNYVINNLVTLTVTSTIYNSIIDCHY